MSLIKFWDILDGHLINRCLLQELMSQKNDSFVVVFNLKMLTCYSTKAAVLKTIIIKTFKLILNCYSLCSLANTCQACSAIS